jgi:hypothetical protein
VCSSDLADCKPENININLIKKNYLFVSKQFINTYIVIPNKDITNKIKYISKYKDEEHIKLLFKPHFDKLKKECYDELALTDWYFIRKIDIGVEIPLEVIEQRNETRKKYNDLINQI